MSGTARNVRCRKCLTGYDHTRHERCPRCGAPSKPTTQNTPAVASGPPAPKPKKERMTPIMRVASKGDGLVYGTPSVIDNVDTKRHKRPQQNTTPIVIAIVGGIALVIGLLVAMGDHGDGKKGKGPPKMASAEQPPAPTGPAYVDPAKMAAQNPPPAPQTPKDPLEDEIGRRIQPPARPGPGPDDGPSGGRPPSKGGESPPERPPQPVAPWRVDAALKAELAPKLKDMNDWPTDKINAEVERLRPRAADAIPALIELIDNEDEMASSWACQMLQKLTGQNKGTPMGGNRDDRRALSDTWKSWFLSTGGAPSAPPKEDEDDRLLNQGVVWAREMSKCKFPGDDEAEVRKFCRVGDKGLVRGLALAAGTEDKAVAAAADKFLKMLTGQDVGGSSAKWLEWWKANEATWKFPN